MGLMLASGSTQVMAAAPSVADALKLAPVQRDVEYDRPAAKDIDACTIKAEQADGRLGWVVRTAGGQILRRFIDTNNDNVVDQWCYFDNGLEVYRDIDSNHNGKADQYRWLNTAGSRWAIDSTEDGRIDAWKAISAEEVSSEFVRAVGDRDASRFSRLLITPEEMKLAGLSATQIDTLSQKIKNAPEKFRTFVSATKGAATVQSVSESSAKPRWVHFGGSMPGLVPEGTNGATKDLLVYENVVAMIANGEKHDQVPIGTMVQVGPAWRLIDAPARPTEGQTVASNDGFFFPSPLPGGGSGNASETSGTTGVDAKLQGLLGQLEKLDITMRQATGGELARLHAERADLLESLAAATTAEDRSLWIRQLADTVSAAVPTGEYPEGVARLKQLQAKLSGDSDLQAYIEFRIMRADYGRQINAPKADFSAIQKQWVENLRKFVEAYPKGSDTPDAMLELAMAQEFAGEEEEALKWYAKIVVDYPQSLGAKKAEGARTRLNSVGKVIELHGTTLDGKTVNLAQLKGKVVIIHYWATDCEPCKGDMAQLKEVLAKYKPDGLEVIGVSLDNQKADLAAYLKTSRVPWPTIFEPGGMDSRLANSMGVLTLPTMLIIDKQGKVANRNANISQVDREVGGLIR